MTHVSTSLFQILSNIHIFFRRITAPTNTTTTTTAKTMITEWQTMKTLSPATGWLGFSGFWQKETSRREVAVSYQIRWFSRFTAISAVRDERLLQAFFSQPKIRFNGILNPTSLLIGKDGGRDAGSWVSSKQWRKARAGNEQPMTALLPARKLRWFGMTVLILSSRLQ